MFAFSTLVGVITATCALINTAAAAQLTQVTNWGANAYGVTRFDIYVPDKLAARPAIILGLHPCGGTGQMFYGMNKLPQYANQLGFVLLYPTSGNQGGMNCWDNHTNKTLLHDGGGESHGLAGMVKYALTKYNGDPDKVFVVGASSGGMMTNVMAATYPDIFSGAAVWSGVPAACWKGAPLSAPMSSDTSCANGLKTYTAQQWGDLAKACYPGYTGRRPRVLTVHGTADYLVVYATFEQQLLQWSNVFGLSKTATNNNKPVSSWNEIVYGDGKQLVGYSVQNGGHIPPFQEELVLKFFGLM